MAASYLPYEPQQQRLLLDALQDWLPEGHLAYFISDSVDSLDLSAFHARYAKGGPRNQPFHPAMMVKVLIYGYATGTFSSRPSCLMTWHCGCWPQRTTPGATMVANASRSAACGDDVYREREREKSSSSMTVSSWNMGTAKVTAGVSNVVSSGLLGRLNLSDQAPIHINGLCTQVQENTLKGGQPGRGAKGRRLHTRPVGSIDRSVSLNRALWVLAEEMRKLKA
jgi:hypothetical protein